MEKTLACGAKEYRFESCRAHRMKLKKGTRILVAMSGGIDSSVAAALLKRAGFDVIGAFMRFWSEEIEGKKTRCCSPEAEKRAKKVASILKIPFYVFNFEKEFKKRIVNYFLKGYKEGITPNPCVVCNKEIKFGLFLEKALKINADFVATGHYAKKRSKVKNQRSKIIYELLKAKDAKRDQSYFLWMLNQQQLKKILFPLGDYTEEEVRNLAKKFKLPVLDIPKSTEICFIKTTINNFLEKYLKENPGKIVCTLPDNKQKIIGRHRGLWFYTIGQRKGIGLPSGPYYVLDKDLKKNLLVVTKNEKDLYKKELICKNVNWISGKKPKLPLKVKAKIRYRHSPALSIITYNGKSKVYNVKFAHPQRAITSGQSIVFYKGKELLGGGIIS